MLKFRTWLIMFALALASLASPQNAAAQERELVIIKAHGFAANQVSFVTAPVHAPQNPVQHRVDAPNVPASLIKIATALAAEATLGANHRFSTSVWARGPVSDGILDGDLVLQGNGNPRLEPEDLLGLAQAVRAAGISQVSGRLIVADALYPRVPVVNPDQPDDAYNAGIGPLAVGFNRVTLHWQRNSQFTVPPLTEARITMAAKANGAATIIDRQNRNDGLVWRVDPRRSQGKQALPVADAGLHAAHLFRDFLSFQGIGIGAIARGNRRAEDRLLSDHASPPLHQILRDMLHYSNNQIAEMVGMAAAVAGGADLASDAGDPLAVAAQSTQNFLRSLLPNIDWSTMVMRNHSGLEPEGRMTAAQIAAILAHAFDHVDLATMLPAAAYSGTLARRLVNETAALRVWAKTGTVFYGSAIAGYIFTGNRQPQLFVIMLSDLARRAEFDANPKRHLELAPAAQAWAERAKAAQDELIKLWLQSS